MGPARLIALTVLGAWTGTQPVHAILFHETGDPIHNTSPPTGDLDGSGWQWQGTWGSALGTPVAPRYFLTAKHVGGSVSNLFIFHGLAFPTTAVARDPESDLALWRVCGLFEDFAPLQTETNEVGLDAVLIGRGTPRGPAVTLTNDTEVLLLGWRWAPGDGRQRWGRNHIDGIADGGPGYGELLRAQFDTNGLPDECHLSTGDSGGALFLNDGTGWKVAGIHYSVDSPYSYTGAPNDTGFNASLFDQGGIYIKEDTLWTLLPKLPEPQPGHLYSTRVSARLEWIRSVLNQNLPDAERLVLLSASSPEGPYDESAAALIDEAARHITVPAPTSGRYFQLRTCFPTRIRSIQLENGQLHLTFE